MTPGDLRRDRDSSWVGKAGVVEGSFSAGRQNFFQLQLRLREPLEDGYGALGGELGHGPLFRRGFGGSQRPGFGDWTLGRTIFCVFLTHFSIDTIQPSLGEL